jgi:hypothetical protein
MLNFQFSAGTWMGFNPVFFRSVAVPGIATELQLFGVLQVRFGHPSGLSQDCIVPASGFLQEFFRVSSGIPEAASGFLQHFLKKPW